MGQFESGKWIIILSIYFFIFIILSSALETGLNYYMAENKRIDYYNSFDNSTYFFENEIGLCTGKGSAMNLLNNIDCGKLDIDDYDNDTCEYISGCEWHNVSDIFGITVRKAGCRGNVNKSHYNITADNDYYCESTSLNYQEICEVFTCSWFNNTDFTASTSNINNNPMSGFNSIMRTLGSLFTFQYDFNMGTYNIILSFILFWIPFLMLLFAIYMALPILH